MSQSALASSYRKRFWFSALLSLTAFGGMMAVLASGKDSASFQGRYAPF